MVKLSPPRPVKAVITDQTASRALDTVYQNTTGRPLLVLATVETTRSADGEAAFAVGYVEDVTPPMVAVGSVGLSANMGAETYEITTNVLVFAVPNGHYYEVRAQSVGGSSVSLNRWIEVEL